MFALLVASSARYETVTVSSPTGPRGVVAWLPPSFDQSPPFNSYYDVLVMSDGENVFNDSTAFGGRSWRAGPTLDDEVGSGRIRELIVLAIYNSPKRIDEYTYVGDPEYGGGDASQYLDWLESSALPDLRPRYRIAESARITILGSSLGGLLACYAAWARPQIYAAAGCMSPSFWWDDQDFLQHLLSRPRPSGPIPSARDCLTRRPVAQRLHAWMHLS